MITRSCQQSACVNQQT